MRMNSSSRDSRGSKTLKPRKKKPIVSNEVLATLDYKNASMLKRFVSERGKILPRRLTGLDATQQRAVAEHVKRARFMALLHYTADQIR